MSSAAHAAAKRPRHRTTASPVARGRTIKFGFIPALDGLRALAVLGVMFYHGGAPIMSGGFLTIDVFFVLSGFLITSLLVGEWRKALTIHLGQFWTRRARRLLPALLVLLVGVAIYAKVLASPGQFANLRLDSLSTLFYVSNWHFIFGSTNYFNMTGTPSPLDHMWSLSIEEQFYFVWPPVVLLMLRLGRRLRPSRQLWPVLVTAFAGSIASAALMAFLYNNGSTVMRVYEGTDTRSQDLLVGATLAIGMAIWARHRKALPEAATEELSRRAARPHPSAGAAGDAAARHRRDVRRKRGPGIRPIEAWEITPRPARIALQVAGWSVIAVMAYLWTHLQWQPTSFFYNGGYYLIAIGVAIVIFCAVTNQLGPVSRALGNSVFVYVGKISYGTYLWHFPLFAILDAERMHLYGYPLLFVRIGVTLLVATASFYLVEEPIRRGRMRALTEWRAWLVTSGAFLCVVAAIIMATLPSTAEAGVPGFIPTGAQYSGPPVKVMVIGDSVAFTMTFAMLLAQPQQAYDVDIDGQGILGCGVIITTEYNGHDGPIGTNGPCNTDTPPAQQLPAVWKAQVDQFHPNVVVLQAGRWEVTDQLVDARWQHMGEPAYDAFVKQSLETAVVTNTSDGALMILDTAPCFASGEQDNGQPWPEDDPARRADYNNLLREVAAEYPTKAEVYDLGGQFCPGGTYEQSVGGVQIREPDGVHVPQTVGAGQWVAAHLLPEVVRVGRLQMAGQPLAVPATSTSGGASPARGSSP